jgi:hypothetical protein
MDEDPSGPRCPSLIFVTTSLRTVVSSGFVSKEGHGVTKRLLPFLTDHTNMAAYRGAAGSFTLTDSSFLTLQDMRPAGKVDLVTHRSERDYLHIRKGSAGSEVGAGLFTKN